MLNTVLASQAMSKACHPHKAAAQPEEKRRQAGSQPKPVYFFHPFFFLLWRRGRRYQTPGYQITKQGCAGQNLQATALCSGDNWAIISPFVWNPTMQGVLSQALQGRSWQVLAWNTPRAPHPQPTLRGHFTLRSHLNETISEKQKNK